MLFAQKPDFGIAGRCHDMVPRLNDHLIDKALGRDETKTSESSASRTQPSHSVFEGAHAVFRGEAATDQIVSR
jgi:hypothetical protein